MTWTPRQTKDGSFTFYSEQFQETFHSHQGARAEAFSKFAQATQLAERAHQPQLRLLDVCYGLGYNSAAALETIWQANPDCQVQLYGLELDSSVPLAATEPSLLAGWSAPVQEVLRTMAEHRSCCLPRLEATLLIGDARQTIGQVHQAGFKADAIFLDPFSPQRCPQLWSVEFLAQLVACLDLQGYLATYSRAASVRAALETVGLSVGTLPLEAPRPEYPHEWSQGTIARFDATGLTPLSPMEQEHLQTRAGIPFRDPELQDPAEVILARQHQVQQQCDRESTSSWRRRWGLES